MQQDAAPLKKVTIYTDGGCIGNPGPGGYGIILLHMEKRREISGGFRLTTNNRMELMAAIIGLETLRFRCAVTIYTDSRYLVDGIMLGWAKRWRANGWRKSKSEAAMNSDLWERLLNLCDRHEVMFKWIRGHANHPENERCDFMSMQAAKQDDLKIDDAYESQLI